ncbi:transposable element Tcb2 transposase [Trichonephila clavipes]|nr:transposable element Tcb2 transposase [Trichonephila clavipes]
MEIPLRTAYGQNGRCGMQPKPSSLRAQAHQSKSRTETCELVKVEQKLLNIRAERKENARVWRVTSSTEKADSIADRKQRFVKHYPFLKGDMLASHPGSYDGRVRLWRTRDERLNPAFDLERHTTTTASVKECGVIAYSTRSPLVLILGTMTAQWYVHDILQPNELSLMQQLPRAIFKKTMLGFTRQECHKTVSALLLPFLGLPDPQICLQSSIPFGMESWASHKFE